MSASLLRRSPSLLISLLVLNALLFAPGIGQPDWPFSVPIQPALAADAPLPVNIYLPSNAATRGPLSILLAIHGMGGDGLSFSAPLISVAERNGWLLVAPTLGYGDWTDPEQLRQDDSYFIPRLKTLIDSLPARTGLQLRGRALLYGHSRGCQVANRFAEFYPQSVLGVAGFSCGTFTMPAATSGALPGLQNLSLAFPYGLADLQRYTGRTFDLDSLRRVSFLIGVGSRDNQAGDVPRQWDPYLGTTRVDRAYAYARAMDNAGVRASVIVVSNVAHAECDEMRSTAMNYLAGLVSS